MNKYIDGAVMLTSVCSLGLTTISIAESKIYEPSNNVVKDLQLERLDHSLRVNLKKTESYIAPTPIKAQPKPIPKVAINLIKEFEGFKDYAYIDTDGTPVIGYGLSRIGGIPVQIGDRISTTQADAALNTHIREIHRELEPIVQVDLSDRQLSALTSIAFNVGVESIKNSTLVQKINAQDYAGAADEFLRWDKANLQGALVQMPGLTRRRAAERQLFLSGSQSS
ncbi:lysozyme [Pleurocapsa sp. CCALA 161]|uniref:lysozyme n=1 Tax=Pleurocapsa sp. CCALA 161 TaxID=2107688 RepID=UPI001E49C01C|nr:lysozyme [Pleurocapsa sp. CCALA 161]